MVGAQVMLPGEVGRLNQNGNSGGRVTPRLREITDTHNSADRTRAGTVTGLYCCLRLFAWLDHECRVGEMEAK